MRKQVILVLMFFAIGLATFAQTKITGRVLDENGNPVSSASVLLKGTNEGTSTDTGGYFSLAVKPGDVVIVSFTGYESYNLKIGSASNYNISLKKSEAVLESVVVTALGIQRKKNQLPFAAQVINGADVSNTRSSNFISNLSGQVAGLNVSQSNVLGGSTNVILRGYKSIAGSNQALFVIDGIPFDNTNNHASGSTIFANQRSGRGGVDYGNNAVDINPDDIESLTVLKGAAASALYGSRAFNGVILVTTKKGKKGGMGITINSGLTFFTIDKSTFPTYQKKYGEGYAINSGYYEDPSGNFLYRDINGDGVKDLVAPMQEDASWGAEFDASKMVYQWDSFDPTSPYYLKPKPWVAGAHDPTTFFEKPVNFNNSIFLTGGSDKGTYKLGFTRNDDKGILPNSKVTKNAVVFKSSYDLTKKISVDAVINYTNTKGIGRYVTGYANQTTGTGNPMEMFRQWWPVNVDVMDLKDAYFRTKKNTTWNWQDPGNLKPIFWNNPYFDRYENYETDYRNRYFGFVKLDYKITSYLNLMGRVSIDNWNEFIEERKAVGSLNNPFYKRVNSTRTELNYDLLLNFDKNVTKDINLKALAGTNIRKEKLETIVAQTNGGLIIPGLYSLANSKSSVSAPSEFEGRREVNGIFAGATISYKELVTLDASVRRDASSTLPKGNNQYWYPAVSAGFVFSNLNALKTNRWFNYGKLRANYAQVGNDAPYYSVKNTFNVNLSPVNGDGNNSLFGSQPLLALPTISNNPNLKPEQNKSFEIGLELAFLKNRIGLDFTYYNAKAINQILSVEISRATGFNSRFFNAGTVQNKGVELSLRGTAFQTKNFSWDVVVNWSKNNSKVLELYVDDAGNATTNIQLYSFQGGVSSNAALGLPYGVIKGKDFQYYNDPKNEVRDPSMRMVNSSGSYLKTAASNYVIADPNPKWIGGITNKFRYKNILFSFLIDIRHKGDIFSLDQYYGHDTGIYPELAGNNDLGKPIRNSLANGGGIILPGVDESGKPNTIRVGMQEADVNYSYRPAAFSVYGGGFVKLREVSLSYKLPSKILEKVKVLKGVDLSLVGRNLWIIKKNLPYSDPEEFYGSGNGTLGYSGNGYPATRQITFNVKFDF